MFNLVMNDWGIGDVICSLYAIEALSQKYPTTPINLYLRQYTEWAELADIPNLKVYRYSERGGISDLIFLYNVYTDWGKRIKHSSSPKKLFSSNLGLTPQIPRIKKSLLEQKPVIQGKYILLSPFASMANRTWELHNWKILARELQQKGYKVIAVGGMHQKAKIREIGVEYFCGQSAWWTMNVCKHAQLIISNDSGIAHIGGWLNTKTLVLMSQLQPQQFYDLTNNRIIMPLFHCTNCKFDRRLGYEERCEYGCWALQAIRPQTVLNEALLYISSDQKQLTIRHQQNNNTLPVGLQMA